MSERKITLFGNKTLGPYRLSEIYDPDADGSNPEASGKVVPALYSQIVDDIHGRKNKIYTVIAVDQNTFKSTMIPSSILPTGDDERIVSYGNDIYMLYYVATSGRLIVDSKLSFFGSQAVKYQIIRVNTDGSATVISKYSDEPGSGAPVVSTIELEMVGGTNVRTCPNCYTDLNMSQGELVYLRLLDESDTMVASVALITHSAEGIMAPLSNPVIDLLVTANQMNDVGDIILYHNQNKKDLVFIVKLKYADLSEQEITIDNQTSYVYGMDEIETSISGSSYQVLFKKYLPSSDYAVNYVATTRMVRIVTAEPYGIAKISIIPAWDPVNKAWSVKHLAYYADKITTPAYITPAVTGHVGNVFDVRQNLVLETTHENPSGVDEQYVQNPGIKYISPPTIVFNDETYALASGSSGSARVWASPTSNKSISYSTITNRWELRQGSNILYRSTNSPNPWDKNVKWYNHTTGAEVGYVIDISADVQHNPLFNNWVIYAGSLSSDVMYGNSSSIHIRPRIYYGTRSGSSGNVYHIPSSLFGTSSTSMDQVLNNFYVSASPPKAPHEAFPSTPTHFRIRSSDTLAALMSPMAIADWNDDLPIASGNTYSGKTVIVEFLSLESGVYKILYGVPVEVVPRSI